MPGMTAFTMPSALVKDDKTATPHYAKFIAEPLEKGYGHTIGNALRRVLLSSMEGVAISAIRVDGVPHEFSSIPDVVEDVTEIIMNMKLVRLECSGDLPRTLELVATKAGLITAAAIREDGVTSVVNTDQVICTLDKDRELRMELEIDRGRGYRPAEDNKRDDHPIGVIAIDCMFSPIERVRYDVFACRVGQRTDYDRLEIEVWADGRVDPEEAVINAARILREHLAVFAATSADETVETRITSEEDQKMLEMLCTSVNDMELSVRAKNCLNNAQIRTVGQLVQKSENEMLKFRNFGKKSLDEIKEKLEETGLSLDMNLKDEVREAFEQRLQAQDKD